MTTIHWFRQDLRLKDNLALLQACNAGPTLLPVVLRDDASDTPTPWGFSRCGPHRRAFVSQSKTGLAAALQALNSDLYQPTEAGVDGLLTLARALSVDKVVCEFIAAPEEQTAVTRLRSAGLTVLEIDQSSLLPVADLPFDIENAPTVFTVFRKAIEQAEVQPLPPQPAPTRIPPLPLSVPRDLAEPWSPIAAPCPGDRRSAFPFQLPGWHGDEVSALAHLERYFASPLPQTYKDTRNGLIGTDYSTKLSPWLAVGALSPRLIWEFLKAHEARFGANQSTGWIGFELLWRDHFRLMMRRFGRQLFLRRGLLTSRDLAVVTRLGQNHNPDALTRWIEGNTGVPFVDAGMRELACTGYLSNRMRQNVASYLVHDLGCDWRAGAAWFEHALIDYDVHSNQGNWAYIAGVGTDPRGGRRFNIQKQANDYDPQAVYQQRWRSQ